MDSGQFDPRAPCPATPSGMCRRRRRVAIPGMPLPQLKFSNLITSTIGASVRLIGFVLAMLGSLCYVFLFLIELTIKYYNKMHIVSPSYLGGAGMRAPQSENSSNKNSPDRSGRRAQFDIAISPVHNLEANVKQIMNRQFLAVTTERFKMTETRFN